MTESAAGRGLDLVILALAVWRLGSLITTERGPWHVFQFVRTKLGGIVHDGLGHVAANPATFWGELLSCQYCCTIWLGVLAAAGYYAVGVAAVWLALPFALSAAALWFNRQVR